jgi:perosamine synthetase
MPTENSHKIDWSGRAFSYSDEEIRTVVDVMNSADPLTQGKHLELFERDFSKYIGIKNAFAFSSCTGALEIAALLSQLGKNDEVIIPAHTFCATAIPFARTGAKIRWADIEPNTRLISAQSVKKLINPKTKVIVVVHLYGLMADMEQIMKLAQNNNCLVVEDCAQAIGAQYKGKMAGSIGDFGTFSFHGQKNLTTLGEGGALTVRSDKQAALVSGLRHNGLTPFKEKREHYWIPAMANVDLDLEGTWPYNFCLGEVSCALASKLLGRLDQMNDLRIKRGRKFISAVSDFPELSFQEVSKDHKHVYHLLSAKYDGRQFEKTNHDFIKLMVYKYRIKTIVQYYPLYRYPLFQKMGLGDHDCPATDDFYDNMVSFPFHHWMSDGQFEYASHTALQINKATLCSNSTQKQKSLLVTTFRFLL